MLKIIDHPYEPEQVIKSNQARIKKALAKKDKVIVFHSEGFVHGRLANIKGVQYKVMKELGKRKDLAKKMSQPSAETQALIKLWGTPIYGKLGVCAPRWQAKRVAYIHWMPCGGGLQPIEIFHLNMLWAFNAGDFFDEIHVRVAGDGHLPDNVFTALKTVLGRGKARLDIKGVVNSDTWEWGTYNEFLGAAKADADMYYLHFKGTSHKPGSSRNASSVFYDYGDFKGITFWSYLMYRALFTIAPTNEKPAVCGLLHANPDWTHRIGWNVHPYHASGSFQGYKGSALLSHKATIDLKLAGARNDIQSMRYMVEGMLTMLFDKSKITALGDVSTNSVGMYTDLYKIYPAMYAEFCKGPAAIVKGYQIIHDPNCRNICVANGTYKFIGGTDTFNWAMSKAFIDLGYTVYYYAPDMDGNGVTEKYLKEIGAQPYRWGIPLAACFANQQSGKEFIGKCPVVQTCHSKWTSLEFPIKGAKAYVSISEEIQDFLKGRGYETILMRNGEDLERYSPKSPLREPAQPAALCPRVLSICQGDDSMLKAACKELGWTFKSVPKEVGQRVWHVEDLINDADIVVGIGRSLYDGMACGRACISWDNRKLNPYTGCGYITAENWHICARANFTGRGLPQINTVPALVAELLKYKPEDGATMRKIAEQELNARTNAKRYLALAGIAIPAP